LVAEKIVENGRTCTPEITVHFEQRSGQVDMRGREQQQRITPQIHLLLLQFAQFTQFGDPVKCVNGQDGAKVLIGMMIPSTASILLKN